MIPKVPSYQTSLWLYELPIWHEGEEDFYTLWCVVSVSANSCTKLRYFSSYKSQLQNIPSIQSPQFSKNKSDLFLFYRFEVKRHSQQQFSRAMHHLQRGKILKTCLATLIRAGISTLSNNSTRSDDPICFPRDLDFPNPHAIPHRVPSQMNPTFAQCMAGSFARWCLSRGPPAAPQSAGWTSPSAAPSAGSRSHPELSPPGYSS